MLDGLAPFFSRNPLLLLGLLLPLAWWGAGWRAWSGDRAGTAVVWTARLVLLWFGAVVLYYVLHPQFFDAAEPTMAAVGWMVGAGAPVYHTVESAERYAHIYGPLVFYVQALALHGVGASLAVSKAVGGAAALGTVWITWRVLRRTTSAERAVVLVAAVVLAWLCFRHYAFWNRPEPLQALMVALALVGALQPARGRAIGWTGLASGALWLLKMTGPAYSLPILVLLHARHGTRAVLFAAAIAATVVALPFVTIDRLSLDLYLQWFLLSAATGREAGLLSQNLQWMVVLGLPIVALYRAAAGLQTERRWRRVAGAAALGAAGIAVAAAKPGSGAYHLLPLVPVLAWLVANRLRSAVFTPSHIQRGVVLASGLTCLCIAILQQTEFVRVMEQRRALDQSAVLREALQRYPGPVGMGASQNAPATFQRPLLVFGTDDYWIDEPALYEHQLAGIEIPRATIEALRTCRTPTWLIPSGAAPFSAVNWYRAVRGQPVYSDAFRQAFIAHYEVQDTLGEFEVWRCRATMPDR